MQNQIQKLFWQDALKRQQIVLSSVVLFLFGIMAFSNVNLIKAANTAQANGTQNVTAGTLDLDTAPDTLAFNNAAAGQASTTTVNTGSNVVQVNDLRGTKAGWRLYGFWETNWVKSGAPTTQMAMTDRMRWFPSDGASPVNNITGEGGEVVNGSNANFAGIASGNNLTLMNTDGSGNNGAGAYNKGNIKFNYDVTSGDLAGSYTTVLNLTLI